jgi:hypothetical protein
MARIGVAMIIRQSRTTRIAIVGDRGRDAEIRTQ